MIVDLTGMTPTPHEDRPGQLWLGLAVPLFYRSKPVATFWPSGEGLTLDLAKAPILGEPHSNGTHLTLVPLVARIRWPDSKPYDPQNLLVFGGFDDNRGGLGPDDHTNSDGFPFIYAVQVRTDVCVDNEPPYVGFASPQSTGLNDLRGAPGPFPTHFDELHDWAAKKVDWEELDYDLVIPCYRPPSDPDPDTLAPAHWELVD